MIGINHNREIKVIFLRMFLRVFSREISLRINRDKAEAPAAVCLNDLVHLRHVTVTDWAVVQNKKKYGHLVCGPVDLFLGRCCLLASLFRRRHQSSQPEQKKHWEK